MNYVRNSQGKTIAFYESIGSRTYLKSTNGRTLGFYDSADNTTRRSNGQHYSYGNTLSQLI